MYKLFKKIYSTLISYFRWFIVLITYKKASLILNKLPKAENSLLLLAWAFPPTITGGVYRPMSLVRHAAANGWNVTVIAGPEEQHISAAGKALSESLPINIHVIRVAAETNIPSHNWFPRTDGGFYNALNVFFTAKKHFVDKAPSIILASGPPFHNFAAAYYLSNYFSSRLILDYRDEWTRCPFPFVSSGKFDVMLERACIDKASKIFFTTRSQLEFLNEDFQDVIKNKSIVIPNGWEPEDFKCSKHLSSIDYTLIDNQDGNLLISFVGNLGAHTLPSVFLQMIEQLVEVKYEYRAKIRLLFVGNKHPAAEEQLNRFLYQEMILKIDHMPKAEANSLMKKSSALLLLCDNNFERYIPGKLYDYLAAGPPIILLGDRGEAADILRTLDAGFIIPINDITLLDHAFCQLFENPNGNRNSTMKDSWLEKHTRTEMSEMMLQEIMRFSSDKG